MKIINIEEKIFIFSERLNLSGKNIIYDNIKSHKKAELYPLYIKWNFGKTIVEVELTSSPLFLELIML